MNTELGLFWVSRAEPLTLTADVPTRLVDMFIHSIAVNLVTNPDAQDAGVFYNADTSKIVSGCVVTAVDEAQAVTIARSAFTAAIENAGGQDDGDKHIAEWRTQLLQEKARTNVVELAVA